MATNLELPAVQRYFGFHTQIQNWKIMHLTLPGRQTVLGADLGLGRTGHLPCPTLLGGDVRFLHSPDSRPGMGMINR
jgi:hypothetical protein